MKKYFILCLIGVCFQGICLCGMDMELMKQMCKSRERLVKKQKDLECFNTIELKREFKEEQKINRVLEQMYALKLDANYVAARVIFDDLYRLKQEEITLEKAIEISKTRDVKIVGRKKNHKRIKKRGKNIQKERKLSESVESPKEKTRELDACCGSCILGFIVVGIIWFLVTQEN